MKCEGEASRNRERASSGDSAEVTCLDGWSLVVLDAGFIRLQGQLVTVLQGWRRVHRQHMPSGSYKVSPVSLLFNGTFRGLAWVREDIGLLFWPLILTFERTLEDPEACSVVTVCLPSNDKVLIKQTITCLLCFTADFVDLVFMPVFCPICSIIFITPGWRVLADVNWPPSSFIDFLQWNVCWRLCWGCCSIIQFAPSILFSLLHKISRRQRLTAFWDKFPSLLLRS